MFKKALFLQLTIILSLISSFSYSQLDSVHYFPALHARTNALIGETWLYLSTPETDSFDVAIKGANGTHITTITNLSNNSPKSYKIGTGQNSSNRLFIEASDVHKALTEKGLIVSAGSHKFYAEVRVVSSASDNRYQATGYASKGTSAIGKEFRIGVIPGHRVADETKNFAIGFMALENTTITVSEFTAGVKFRDSNGQHVDPNSGNGTTHTFNLTAGQTYTLTGYEREKVGSTTTTYTNNIRGMQGALVKSTGNIVMSAGNLGGYIAINPTDGNDITNGTAYRDLLMEQGVPMKSLGTEHILIKGNGQANQEIAFVIATENDTQVTVNGVVYGTYNAGKGPIIPSTKYSNDGNMSITTNKPAYVYQCVGGNNALAMGELFLIPPIHCRLSNEIDLMADVNKIGAFTLSGDLLIITKKGSTVKVNGTTLTNAKNVTGNTNYVTYKKTGVTGNQKITSTGPVMAGFLGYNSYADYGSFYAGFADYPSVEISATSDEICESGNLDITFTMKGGTAPYRYTYSINGVNQPTITTNDDVYTMSVNTTSGGTLNYVITEINSKNVLGNADCPYIKNDSYTIKIDKKPQLPSSISIDNNDQYNCHGRALTLTANGGKLEGGASYVWGTTSNGNELGSTSQNTLSVNPSTTTTYYVGVTSNGACEGQFLNNGVEYTLPTPTNVLAGDGAKKTCYVAGNNTIHFYDDVNQHYIGSINPKGRTGYLTFTTYVSNNSRVVDACGSSNDNFKTAILDRNYTVIPALGGVTSGQDMEVYFTFKNAELDNLISASSGLTPKNANDDVALLTDLVVTKYSNPGQEDGDPYNNCEGGSGVVLHQMDRGENPSTALGLKPSLSGDNRYVMFNVASFSEFYLHGDKLNTNSPLPVELVSFTADCSESEVMLKWITATENNTNHFEVLGSLDGVQWEIISTVPAAGNSSVENTYFTHDITRNEAMYYVLRTVDNDGTVEVSQPISIICDITTSSWSIYPMPIADNATVSISSTEDIQTQFSVVDMNGKIIKNNAISITKGTTLLQLNVAELATGVYVVHLQHKDFQPIRIVKM